MERSVLSYYIIKEEIKLCCILSVQLFLYFLCVNVLVSVSRIHLSISESLNSRKVKQIPARTRLTFKMSVKYIHPIQWLGI